MKFAIIASLTAVVALGGCTTGVGNQILKKESQATIHKKLTEGTSTKADVRNLYGAPHRTSFTDSGLEIWSYVLVNHSRDGLAYIPIINWFGDSITMKQKELVILFDKNGSVQKFSMNESIQKRNQVYLIK